MRAVLYGAFLPFQAASNSVSPMLFTHLVPVTPQGPHMLVLEAPYSQYPKMYYRNRVTVGNILQHDRIVHLSLALSGLSLSSNFSPMQTVIIS
jgi:hypothetical protein